MTTPSISLFDPEGRKGMPGPLNTLREVYEAHILPELEVEATTLEQNHDTLTLWERYTKNPAVALIDKKTVKDFRAKLISKPWTDRSKAKRQRKRSNQTVNKHMRHLSGLISPLWPADRKNPDGKGFIAKFFRFPKPLAKQKKLPFTYSRDELSALHIAAEHCKIKNLQHRAKSHLYEPALWRLALVLAVNAGPRTWDLFKLKKSDFHLEQFRYGSVEYIAKKTGKPQRAPLNKVTRKHLDYVLSLNLDPVYVFPGFKKTQAWYNAWKRICAAANVHGTFESLRKTCSTMHNNVVYKAGAWLTGHELRGVNAESYDNPTNRVLRAVYRLRLPDEFKRAADALSASTST